MGFALSPEARAAHYRVESFDTIGSTNSEAMARARAGEGGPLWIASRHQSAGRGRRGNAWSTDDGNLAASLLLVLDLPPLTIANLGFVAGLALATALDRCCGAEAEALRLKWPNDLLSPQGKVAGILLETERLNAGAQAVVIGIGVNVSSAPDHPAYPVTSLRALGCRTDAQTLFSALTTAWIECVALWENGRQFDLLRQRWLRRAGGVGGAIRVRMPKCDIEGVFETIDEQGRLLLRSPDGILTAISAGEIHFPNAVAA